MEGSEPGMLCLEDGGQINSCGLGIEHRFESVWHKLWLSSAILGLKEEKYNIFKLLCGATVAH